MSLRMATVIAAGLLAAPAFAQTPGGTGPDGSGPSGVSGNQAEGPRASTPASTPGQSENQSGATAPQVASTSPAPLHRRATSRNGGTVRTASRGGDSGNAAVDDLNAKSLQAAQKGQNFTPAGSSQ